MVDKVKKVKENPSKKFIMNVQFYYVLIDENGEMLTEDFYVDINDLESMLKTYDNKLGKAYYSEIIIGLLKGKIKWQKIKLIQV